MSNSSSPLFVLGPVGTYSHQAGLRFQDYAGTLFPDVSAFDISLCTSNIDVLCKAKECGGFCVVAIENSRGGLVDETIHFWLSQSDELSMQVVGDVYFPVRHHMLMLPSCDGSEHVQEVFSHPQAFRQCSKNIRRLYPSVTMKGFSSTAAAALEVLRNPSRSVAIIGSSFLADVYGLNIVHTDVQDFPDNVTRFHVVGSHSPDPDLNADSKTAIIFKVSNSPGSLVRILSLLSQEEVNITAIHSIPLGVIGEYAFYCEFCCHQKSHKGREIIERMRSLDKHLFVLGSFSTLPLVGE